MMMMMMTHSVKSAEKGDELTRNGSSRLCEIFFFFCFRCVFAGLHSAGGVSVTQEQRRVWPDTIVVRRQRCWRDTAQTRTVVLLLWIGPTICCHHRRNTLNVRKTTFKTLKARFCENNFYCPRKRGQCCSQHRREVFSSFFLGYHDNSWTAARLSLMKFCINM